MTDADKAHEVRFAVKVQGGRHHVGIDKVDTTVIPFMTVYEEAPSATAAQAMRDALNGGLTMRLVLTTTMAIATAGQAEARLDAFLAG